MLVVNTSMPFDFEEEFDISKNSTASSRVQIVLMSWLSHVLSDPRVAKWLSWILTPVVIAFVLPVMILLFIWSSSLLLYIHRVHKRRLMRRLREAANERDIAKAGREIVAALWDAQANLHFHLPNMMMITWKKAISLLLQGWLWHGYEVVGLDKIPETGPALLLYYHGALPLDYYYLVAKTVLLKRRIIHSVSTESVTTKWQKP